MTRCIERYNIKSSVYNQTGESYGEQLGSHRKMCEHVRRVLGAKSVVDTRNSRYFKSTPKRCRTIPACKLRIFQPCPSDETIDKLAYDTELHPADNIMQIQCNKRSKEKSSCCRPRNDTNNCSCGRDCPDPRKQTFAKRTEDCCNVKSNPSQSPYHRRSRASSSQRQCGKSRPSSCDRRSEDFEASHQSCNENPSPVRRSLRRNEAPVLQCACPKNGGLSAEHERRISDRCEDDARYARFVHDITQDIIHSQVHTDAAMKEIFNKHIKRNAGTLNRRKMLYEILQLKISLNIEDDEEEEEEDETEIDLVYAENFPSQRGPKPPTPPKTLNEHKVIDKLEQFKNNGDDCHDDRQRKCVVLVDPNPEIIVTERDVLTTLMDNDLNPQQIERIHQNLFKKAKDVQVCETKAGKQMNCVPISRVERTPSTVEFINSYSKERVHGILRKECKNYEGMDKAACQDQDPMRRPSCLKSKYDDAVDKCSKWKQDTSCVCKSTTPRSPPSSRSSRGQYKGSPPPPLVVVCKPAPAKKENGQLSPKKVDPHLLSPRKSPGKRYPGSSLSSYNRRQTIQKLEGPNLGRKEKVTIQTDPQKSFLQVSQVSRHDDDGRSVVVLKNHSESFILATKPDVYGSSSHASEYEIEEELESEISEQKNKEDFDVYTEEDEEDRLNTVNEEDDSSSNSKKELCDSTCKEEQLAREKKEKEEKENKERTEEKSDADMESIASIPEVNLDFDSQDDSLGLTDSPSPNESSRINDTEKNIANGYAETWRLSTASSNSIHRLQSGDSEISSNVNSDTMQRPEAVEVGTTIKHPGRKSLGLSGVGIISNWNDGFSEMKSQPGKYCQASCKTGDGHHMCSKSCKYYKLGCKNLSTPTDCLRIVESSSTDRSS